MLHNPQVVTLVTFLTAFCHSPQTLAVAAFAPYVVTLVTYAI